MTLIKSKTLLPMIVAALAITAIAAFIAFNNVHADASDGEPVTYTPASSSITLVDPPVPAGDCETTKTYRVTIKTAWIQEPFAVERRTVYPGDDWASSITVDKLDPGLVYRFKVRAICPNPNGANATADKNYGDVTAPGFMPQAPFGYITGDEDEDEVYFHLLPNSICEGFIFRYRAQGANSWTKDYVSNNFPSRSYWNDHFWMFTVDNTDPVIHKGRIECVYANTGTDADPNYQTTKMIDNLNVRYNE